jgi:hypothetical protein
MHDICGRHSAGEGSHDDCDVMMIVNKWFVKDAWFMEWVFPPPPLTFVVLSGSPEWWYICQSTLYIIALPGPHKW